MRRLAWLITGALVVYAAWSFALAGGLLLAHGLAAVMSNQGGFAVSRDFAAEMRELMDAERAAAGYVKVDARDRIVKHCRETDKELWQGWLDLIGPGAVWEALDKLDRWERTRAKRKAERAPYSDAVAAHEAGDPEALRRFIDMPITINGGTKPLGSLYAVDIRLARPGYDRRAKQERLMGALLAAVENKIGRKRVDEVFTNAQLERMWQSISGAEAA